MWIKHSIVMNEPQWGKELLTEVNEAFVWCETTANAAPILADGIVFTYPFLLVIWYLLGLKEGKSEMKIWALSVFASAVLVAVLNVVIQYFIDKQRPEGYINNADLLIMDHLPTAPFPSDHAAVWFAVAGATLFRATKHNHRGLTIIWVFLLIGAFVMAISRVGVAIHRPTDVIVWAILWILVAWFVVQQSRPWTILRMSFDKLIWVQEWLFGFLKK